MLVALTKYLGGNDLEGKQGGVATNAGFPLSEGLLLTAEERNPPGGSANCSSHHNNHSPGGSTLWQITEGEFSSPNGCLVLRVITLCEMMKLGAFLPSLALSSLS